MSAYDCLWEIHVNAESSYHISIYQSGVSSVANALKKKQALNMEDSLKVMIAYINMIHDLDTIPLKINVTPYYYNYNEGIANIKFLNHTSINMQQTICLRKKKITVFHLEG